MSNFKINNILPKAQDTEKNMNSSHIFSSINKKALLAYEQKKKMT